MSLTAGSRIIAEARIQNISLRPVLGAYELIININFAMRPASDQPSGINIHGVRVSMGGTGSKSHDLGFARPERQFSFIQHTHPLNQQCDFFLTLHPGQLAALDRVRGTSDLDFNLLIHGVARSSQGAQDVQDDQRFHIPQSQWIKKLKDAGARNTLLLEVPLPLHPTSEAWTIVADHLQKAEQQFRSSDYQATVASCRTVVEELGSLNFGTTQWASKVTDIWRENRAAMTKEDRIHFMWVALRNYAHLAHHGESEGGNSNHTRADALLVLTLTSSFVAHLQAS